MVSKAKSYMIDFIIGGYHIYKGVWSSFIGEVLCCRHDNESGEEAFRSGHE